jgi:predicted PurR-regulated permease PerM
MYTGKFFNERLKFVGFLLILVSLTGLIVYELRYFSSSVLGAFTLYTLLRKPYKKLLAKGWKRLLAIAFLVASTFLFIFVIGGGVTSVVYVKIKTFHPQVILENIRLFHQAIIQKFGYALFPEDILGTGVHWLGNALPGLLSATGNVIANVILMVFVLIFMLHGSEKFERGLDNFLPVSRDSIRLLKKETSNMIISNAIGVPLIMFGQGSMAALAYWFTDAGDPVIWGMLTGFFGLIPVVGTATVWLPLSLNLLIGGHHWHGLLLLVWSGCVVSFIDNAIRMVFLKKYANIHPLIPLFGVIVGINLFGFWGIIFGPLVLSGFLLLVKIFHREFLVSQE